MVQAWSLALVLCLSACGGGGEVCGDGTCDGTETASSCAADCVVGMVCENPTIISSAPSGGMAVGDYYVRNNCNRDYGCTLYFCSVDSFYEVANFDDSDPMVKAYPSVEWTYRNGYYGALEGMSLTATFAAYTPHVGIYSVAFDIELWNYVNTSSAVERTRVTIWTESYGFLPAGEKVDSVTLGTQEYDVLDVTDPFWQLPGGRHLAFVPTEVMVSGTIDLRGLFLWLANMFYVAPDAKIEKIAYGAVIVSTGGEPARFDFTDFSIDRVPMNPF